jgi:hypothetical protein
VRLENRELPGGSAAISVCSVERLLQLGRKRPAFFSGGSMLGKEFTHGVVARIFRGRALQCGAWLPARW